MVAAETFLMAAIFTIFYSSRATFLTWRKRSTCKKYEYWRPTDDRPTTDQRPTSGPIHTFWKKFKWP